MFLHIHVLDCIFIFFNLPLTLEHGFINVHLLPCVKGEFLVPVTVGEDHVPIIMCFATPYT